MLALVDRFIAEDGTVFDEAICLPGAHVIQRPSTDRPWWCYHCGQLHPPLDDEIRAQIWYAVFVILPNVACPISGFGRVRPYVVSGRARLDFLPYRRPTLTIDPLAIIWNVADEAIEYSPRNWRSLDVLGREAKRYLKQRPGYGDPSIVKSYLSQWTESLWTVPNFTDLES